jgi:hypothetical protein
MAIKANDPKKRLPPERTRIRKYGPILLPKMKEQSLTAAIIKEACRYPLSKPERNTGCQALCCRPRKGKHNGRFERTDPMVPLFFLYSAIILDADKGKMNKCDQYQTVTRLTGQTRQKYLPPASAPGYAEPETC